MTQIIDHPIAVTAGSFEQAVRSASHERLVVVDVWAAWCGPCKALSPILDEVAREEAGRLLVAKIDADAEPELTGTLGVRALPTLLFFRNGEVVDRLVGLHGAAAIRARAASHQFA
jgi:thioredoxin 1